MRHRGQPITIDTLPNTHERMRGTYSGETDDGVPFELYVHSGQRRAGGNDLMRAHIRSLTQGRPMSSADLHVKYDEIYILIGNQQRKDIRVNPNGSYGYGNIHGRTFKDIVVNMLEAFGPKPKIAPETAAPTGPKPF
ncbi:hypothetical protein [Rhizobium sp. BK176]|uniref:hypothetical protein n=1 Tax=Rhizobium sp. BK176 TaxID=2587071 RepID=UPI002167C4AA|nr:hypothetical protein [Rhizobium sp. BK176]MCS4089631.1 hypothetical protein [Rhizobium sp. BK176]